MLVPDLRNSVWWTMGWLQISVGSGMVDIGASPARLLPRRDILQISQAVKTMTGTRASPVRNPYRNSMWSCALGPEVA